MSKRYIGGQMVEVPDTSTQAVLDSLHGTGAREDEGSHLCTDYELCPHCWQCHACCGCY